MIASVTRASAPPTAHTTPRPCRTEPLHVLFLVSAHNSLSQRVLIELTALAHTVAVAVVCSADDMEAAVDDHRPDLIVCPMLKSVIPESVWSEHRCLIVHPGPRGDRGPSSLDWAIELDCPQWGVTVLEADEQLDAGQVWATRTFPMRPTAKSSLYRHEVRRAATAAVIEAITKVSQQYAPRELDEDTKPVTGRLRPLMTQTARAIDWESESTETVIRKVRSGDGQPGVLDSVCGVDCFLFGAHAEGALRGRPGEIIAQRVGAICRATTDGAVWVTHLRRRDTPSETFFKLPATRALELAGVKVAAPEVPAALHASQPQDDTYREIVYYERSRVGYLHFDFYNGAMSTDQCRRLYDAYRYAQSRAQTKVIVLMGGHDFYSNGIHLNVIEAAVDPATESWRNLTAIDDLVREIIDTPSHLVISALTGDAAAGGVPLAAAADYTLAREDVVLNPYYGHMGGLYGSEYWTYLLPRRIGTGRTTRMMVAPFVAVGTRQAVEIGLLDRACGSTAASFTAHVREYAMHLAHDEAINRRLERKRRQRAEDEQARPLRSYRAHELARCHENFFGADRSYHEARHRFVHKLGPACAVTAPTRPVAR